MTTSTRSLSIDDITDLRAYERERDDFRTHVIGLKKKRRIAVGPYITLLFENRDTIRFQIQEMARIEKIISDEGIEAELSVYNPLIPQPGGLSATLFIELTSEELLREWLPKLVGIERAAQVWIGEGDDRVVVAATPDEAHDAQLTRDDVTSSVHYIGFRFTPDQVAAISGGAALSVAVDHPTYQHHSVLSATTVTEFLTDLLP